MTGLCENPATSPDSESAPPVWPKIEVDRCLRGVLDRLATRPPESPRTGSLGHPCPPTTRLGLCVVVSLHGWR